MDDYGGSLELIAGDDIEIRSVDWLWPGWLASGKLHVLAGVPGTGKTTLALALAATITSCGRWPDGTASAPSPGNVLLWSGEDDPGDTLVPRLMACGADVSLVHFVGGVQDVDGRRAFDPAHDAAILANAVDRIPGLDLIIVDPVVSAVSGDSHKNAETRRALQPLCDLAVLSQCAVLGITHFTKGTQGKSPLDRVTGSLAFGAVARVVLGAAKLDEGRIFVRVKNNLGKDGDGFKYELGQTILNGCDIEASAVWWGEHVEGEAHELLAEADTTDDDRTATDEAVEFLRELLKGGGMKASDVKKEARQADISEKCLRRAREKLGIKPSKAGFSGGWRWSMPADERSKSALEDAQDAEDAPNARPGNGASSGAEGTFAQTNGSDERSEYDDPYEPGAAG